MKFGMVNKLTNLNRFVHHTLQRNITRLAVITRKTRIKLRYLERGGTGKEPKKNFMRICDFLSVSVDCSRKSFALVFQILH